MLRKVSFTLLIFALLFIHIGDFQTPTTVHAATTVSWSGTLASPDPTWDRVNTNCVGPSSRIEWYDTQPFYVDATGLYTIDTTAMTGPNPDNLFALYQNSFDPTQPSTNCVRADDDSGGMFLAPRIAGVTLTAGVQYILVTTQCCDGTTAGQEVNYTNQITGVGNITLGQIALPGPSVPVGSAPRPGPDMIPIPDTAVVGQVLFDTPGYTLPLDGYTSFFTITAGKTLWVFGLDESLHFYKVVLAGHFFWLPVRVNGSEPGFRLEQQASACGNC